MSVQANVEARYAEGAKDVQAELCCPVNYDKELLKILPQEIIEKDYGCGDPSRYVREGDTVMDVETRRVMYRRVTLYWTSAVAAEKSVTWRRNWWVIRDR